MLKNLLLKAGKRCLLVLCIFTFLVAAAEMKITGKVIGNDDRQPVAGATVTVISAGKKRRRSFAV